jgi:hypothetical protein
VGSVGIGAWIARLAFPTLLLFGWARGELGPRSLTVFVLLGLSVWIGLPRLLPNGGDFVTSALAVLDIALVLIVFKGDVRIT